jgi:P4 family phage/plasmid primase-like protien
MAIAIRTNTGIETALTAICERGAVYELRIPNSAAGTVSGYFTDLHELAVQAEKLNAIDDVYITMNPVNADLLARATNRVQHWAKNTSADHDVSAYRWILLDFDPVRPAGISSTADEHQAALDRAGSCREWLMQRDISHDSLILADSGNGAHILLRADLPNDPDGESRRLAKGLLRLLDLYFTDDQVILDQTTGNPSRLCKLYGTFARKGDSTVDRPHRRSELLIAPEPSTPVNPAVLSSLVDEQPSVKGSNGDRNYSSIDMDCWVATHLGDVVKRTGPWNNGGTKYVLNPCPFNADHTNDSAYIVRFAENGGIGAGCHHHSCKWDWAELRAKFEPSALIPAPGTTIGVPNPLESLPQLPIPFYLGRPDFPLTDIGNAERLVQRYGDLIRYCFELKSWFVYQGTRWYRCPGGEIRWMAQATVKAIYAEARAIDDDEKRKKTGAWAHRSESAPKINAMIELARSQSGILIRPELLDRDPFLLNVRNGTIDLRTGDLRPHNPYELITKVCASNYLKGADCPRWKQFLDTTMGGSQPMIDFLQRAIGYMLTGDTSEQCFFFLYGSGANGKSTLVESIAGILGDYFVKTPIETFLPKRSGSIPNDVASLRGARMVVASEVQRDNTLATGVIKDITGGDTLSARFLHAEFFSFKPECKIILYGNHRPNIDQSDHGTWRRVRVVPFDVTIHERDQDLHLQEKLCDEREGILAWAVEGCLRWQRDGLGMPEEVATATANYREEMDTLADFIDDCCIVGSDLRVLVADLYRSYTDWCADQHEDPLSERAFGTAMEERGHLKHKGTGGRRYRRYLDVQASS